MGHDPDVVVATQIQAAAAPDGPERDHLLLLAKALHGCAKLYGFRDTTFGD
jgi:hypothetical protein